MLIYKKFNGTYDKNGYFIKGDVVSKWETFSREYRDNHNHRNVYHYRTM